MAFVVVCFIIKQQCMIHDAFSTPARDLTFLRGREVGGAKKRDFAFLEGER